ncbi:hypothetical protein [Geitlerinema sp. PCC 7407]|uniref:hypothetical protein n=1 Tax=Geitlerinema sp. PCC 7407 TaxID=1173025 RepID=UPI00029FCACB|nr:hypothetical protein [Geitlerinema sp. PCC 7407]AFY67261.1 hypothetical protein GEI7407_2788 [Geitlerinema sp. PCC 7407]
MFKKRSLLLPCKRYLVSSLFLARLLGINKFLLFQGILPYGKALKIQSCLLNLWMLEQKRLCATTFRVLEESFADGSVPSDANCLEYFQDLKTLEAEGRYDCVLNQLYLPRNEFLEINHDEYSTPDRSQL